MLHEFLDANRAELIKRCRGKVASRSAPKASLFEMEHGIPRFLAQLIDSLRIEDCSDGRSREAARAGVSNALSASATRHGRELLLQGFTVNQVVHDYGDLCQAVTELAVERGAKFSADEFHTLNRCLDNAMADAVTAFDERRDHLIAERGDRAMGERLGYLAHELRNHLNTATLAFAAMKLGTAGIQGATSGVLERSLAGLRELVDSALADVRLTAGVAPVFTEVAVERFLSDVEVAAGLEARNRDCAFTALPVEPGITIHVDAQLLSSALSNMLQNAFKFTHSHGQVTLSAHRESERLTIEVADECGGLPANFVEMFTPFTQGASDRSGLGLGLSIARRAVEACGGHLGVRNYPGKGCVFAIDLPCRVLEGYRVATI
jgi:signal transduction histidine kinase